MNRITYTRTTLREIRHGEAFCIDPDMVKLGREKPRTMITKETCSARPHNHFHLAQDCYWIDAVVYRVTLNKGYLN